MACTQRLELMQVCNQKSQQTLTVFVQICIHMKPDPFSNR